VLALTETEARARAALIEVVSYELFADLTAEPVRTRSEIRFTCAEPGAATFAELAARAVSAVLNGREVGPPDDGRLALPGLAAENTLVVEAEADGDVLTRFTDPADGAGYLLFTGYPTASPRLFGCFDQAALTATSTLSLMLPAGWGCLTNGPVTERPPAGEAGRWRFGLVSGTRPWDWTIAAGPYASAWNGTGGADGSVRMSIWCRRSLAGTLPGLERFAGLARQALEYYERMLGVPCPYPKYDIGFVPQLNAQAISIPGLMLVNENLLARMADPDDDFVAMLAGHEVSHLWFGCHIAARWWDDLWLDEAMASYVSYTAMTQAEGTTGPWTAFSYREKPRAYEADALPSRQPVSSPVATAADAMFRPNALTYSKGTAVIRQLAALIGDEALRAGLADYMRRFGGTASTDDLIGCWSRSSGRDLSGWAQEWLRTEGASTLRVSVTPQPSVTGGPDGTLASLAVEQDEPRTHRLGIGLYDWSGPGSAPSGLVLRRRRVISAEVSGARCEIPVPPGEPVPAAVVPNDGDLTYAQIAFDPASLEALAAAAMNTGDPLTEAACWNAAWRMVTAGALSGADLAGLVTRRLAGSPFLPAVGLEVLLGWAVTAADLYTGDTERGAARAALAAASLAGTGATAPGSPAQRALAAGFAASAHTGDQLAQARAWLDGGPRPDGLDLDGDLRERLLRTLAARGLATDEDLDALAAADPVAGERNRAACGAARPDAAAKEAAWELALGGGDRRLTEAAASAMWVPGQEALLAGYRDRYFTEALPVLDGRDLREMRRLARALYPVTLAGPATLAAAAAQAGAEVGTERDALSPGLRLVLQEQEAIMVAALAARSQPRRWP
jgi:aminopeptidase N